MSYHLDFGSLSALSALTSLSPLSQSLYSKAPSSDSSFSSVLGASLNNSSLFGALNAPGSLSAPTYGSIDLNAVFEHAAATYNLPVNLLKAIGKIESGFDPNAVSSAGAMGVMQLMPQTAQHLGVSDPFDPVQNIMGGAKLIAEHLEQYDGNLDLALAAYNSGVGTVAKYGGQVPPFTRVYIEKVKEVLGLDLTAPYVSVSGSRSGGQSSDELLAIMLMSKLLEMMSKDKDDDKIPL